MTIREHRWKSTLVYLQRKFLSQCSPQAIIYNAFDPATKSHLYTPEGETIWAIYAIGVHEDQIWWKACFTDTQILVEDFKGSRYAIPYADMSDVRLPEPSKAPFVAEFRNAFFCYDCGFIIGHNGEEYEVRGGVREDGKRDIYLWFAIVGGARRDQERHVG